MKLSNFRRFFGASLPSSTPAVAYAQIGASTDDLIFWIIAFGSLMVVGIVAVAVFAPAVTARKQAELIEKFVEHDREIPPELLVKMNAPATVQLTPEQQRLRSMRRGVVLLALAVGIALIFYIGSGDLRAAAWGLPP